MNENFNIPNHIAIIMDGNGRYAKKRLMPKRLGHKEGAETLRKITDYAKEIGVKTITAYAFSTENWKRSQEEVNDIMNLLREYIKQFGEDSKKKDVKVVVIGDLTKLDTDLQQSIHNLMEDTKNKEGFTLNLAINYGGRDEIIRATKKIVLDYKNKDVNEINEEVFEKYLDTSHCESPDLLIRTSNEYRISNFLLWQLAYAEFHYTHKLWPDFSKKDLDLAIEDFNKRNRRFGGRNDEN